MRRPETVGVAAAVKVVKFDQVVVTTEGVATRRLQYNLTDETGDKKDGTKMTTMAMEDILEIVTGEAPIEQVRQTETEVARHQVVVALAEVD